MVQNGIFWTIEEQYYIFYYPIISYLSCTRPIWRCPKMVRTGTFEDTSGTRPGHVRPGTHF